MSSIYKEYCKFIKIIILEPISITDKSFIDLPKKYQIPTPEENMFKAKEYLYCTTFKVKPIHFEAKIQERIAYVKRLHRNKKIMHLIVMDKFNQEEI